MGLPGSNSLPLISGNITLKGQGENSTTIQREVTAAAFRIFHVESGGNLTLEGLTIRGGRLVSRDSGGAIFNQGVVNIVDATISDNRVFELGGAILNSGTLNIADSIIANNFADVSGGIHNSGVINITRSTLSDNHSLTGGGMATSGVATIVNSTIAFNTAGSISGSVGGGIVNSGTVEIISSTIGNNLANSQGGGIGNFSGTIKIKNSTIAGNHVGFIVLGGAGGIFNENGVIELQNTILALNTAEDRFGRIPSDCAGDITSLGNNLVSVPAGCSFTFLSSDLTGEPGLDSFKNIEAAGKGHFPLLATSQAIDAGNNILCLTNPLLVTDQLGLPRVGTCDIGSVEFQGGMQLVNIDIRPRSDANRINPNSSGNINVAILSDNGFDARTIDPNTVRFGATGIEAAPIHVGRRDVDGDGDRDLVLRFQIQDTGIRCGDTSAVLTGQISGGPSIIGSSPIQTIQCDR